MSAAANRLRWAGTVSPNQIARRFKLWKGKWRMEPKVGLEPTTC